MILIIIINILFLLLQFALSSISWNTRGNIRRKYAKPISSLLTPEKILQQNEKRFSQIDLKVVSYLDDVGYSDKNLMLINKRDLSTNTLYINFKFFYYFYLASEKNNYLRNLKRVQNILFTFQVGFFIIGLITINLAFNAFFLASLGLQIFLFTYSIFNYIIHGTFIEETYRKSKKILELDNVEEARLESLLGDINQEVFEYPFEILWRIIQFVKP